jgi:Sec-independent protein translocase protein TatA
MFGWGELGIIVVLAIVLLGPDKLPEVMRTLGKLYAEYNNAKRRFELEVLQGQNLPERDFLQRMAQNKMNLIKEEVTSSISESTENYINTESDNNISEVKEHKKNVSESNIKEKTTESGKNVGEAGNKVDE